MEVHSFSSIFHACLQNHANHKHRVDTVLLLGVNECVVRDDVFNSFSFQYMPMAVFVWTFYKIGGVLLMMYQPY